jgi:hypothetical protein
MTISKLRLKMQKMVKLEKSFILPRAIILNTLLFKL